MTTTTVPQPPVEGQPVDAPGGGKGLKAGALGLLASVVLGVAATAPAYSLTAALGLISQEVGAKAPIVMLLGFVPILFVSFAYRALNSRMPDCGTTFSWTAKIFGPHAGWMCGWAAVTAQIIVLGNLARIVGTYALLLLGLDEQAASPGWVALAGSLWLALTTCVAYRGIEISARLQLCLLVLELAALATFAAVALGRVYTGGGIAGSTSPALDWFNPFSGMSLSGLSAGILVAIFAYWGWDAAMSANEETADSTVTPGRSAIISTALLLTTYLLVSVATLSFAGAGTDGVGLANPDNGADALSPVGAAVLGSFWGKVLILAVLSSACAATQTTLLPCARSSLAMAVNKALPDALARVSRRFCTPSVATWTIGTVAVTFFVTLSLGAPRVLADLILVLGLLIAFYYGMTGLAAAWFFRKELHGAKDLLVRGVLPLLGGVILFAAFFRSAYDLYTADSETRLFGLSGAFVLGIGALGLGALLMFAWQALRPAFFRGQTLTVATAPEASGGFGG